MLYSIEIHDSQGSKIAENNALTLEQWESIKCLDYLNVNDLELAIDQHGKEVIERMLILCGCTLEKVVTFEDLDPEWKLIARNNLDHLNQEHLDHVMFIEPKSDHDAETHVLYDLEECARSTDNWSTGIIPISNSSVRLIYFNEAFDLDYNALVICKYI